MLLSVIIPTKNRYDNLYVTISELVKINSAELEIVIQDNTDSNEDFLVFLKELNDSRIKYFHSTDFMNTATNSDLAVLNSTGEYLCYIGDDDCVNNKIVDLKLEI